MIWRDGRTGERAAAHPVAKDGAYRQHFGAPYFGTHRADLQRVLGGAHGPERLHLGHRVIGIEERHEVVRLDFASGASVEADLVIGADGARSTVRRYVSGEERAAYPVTSAFRGIVPARDLPGRTRALHSNPADSFAPQAR